jgi:hypothetical protein
MSVVTGGGTALHRAFLVRDRRIETSYRAGLILRLASAVATVAVFFFLSRTFDDVAPGLTGVGTSYFAFVLIGIMAQEFLSQSVGGFGSALRESQTTGTLELMLLGRSHLARRRPPWVPRRTSRSASRSGSTSRGPTCRRCWWASS